LGIRSRFITEKLDFLSDSVLKNFEVFLIEISQIVSSALSNRAQDVDHIHTGPNDRLLSPSGQDATVQADK
jgi:hypothetical protein